MPLPKPSRRFKTLRLWFPYASSLSKSWDRLDPLKPCPILLDLLEKDKDASIKNAVIGCLVSYDDPSIASVVIRMFASLDSEGKLAAESLLASRSDWAKSLLKAMDAQTISEDAISIAAVRRMNMHQDAELAAALQKRWGNLSGASSVGSCRN
ncbi:MAG: hypothetical protein U0905_22780 [Pirellulales bacterium]